MLSAITLGLRVLQMILAIALLGLSITLISSACNDTLTLCVQPVTEAFDKDHAPRTVRYSVFLGGYGILISAIGIVTLFVERIPTIVPLVGDALGALFFLAGGIAWVVSIAARVRNCSAWRNARWSKEAWENMPSDLNEEYRNNALVWVRGVSESACRQGEAAHGLVWALFAFTAGLAICDYFRRRDQAKSFK